MTARIPSSDICHLTSDPWPCDRRSRGAFSRARPWGPQYGRATMRLATLAGLGFLTLAAAAAPALADDARVVSGPDTRPCPDPLAALATCYSAKLDTGAYLLAAMPKDWNGNLVVFAHGGPALVPPTANTSQGDLVRHSHAVKAGYAW